MIYMSMKSGTCIAVSSKTGCSKAIKTSFLDSVILESVLMTIFHFFPIH